MRITKEMLLSWLQMTLGAIVAAFALEEFLAPNNIFDGGVVGVSMIVSHYLPLKTGVFIIIFNIPFLIIGLMKLGKLFVVKVVYSIILFSILTMVFEPVPEVTDDIILAVTFGGFLLGVGVGLVLRGGGCLDGTEIVAVLINKKFSFSIGTTVLLCNVVIYAIAGVCFGLSKGMYSLLMYFITSYVIDVVEVGFDTTKSVMIFTDDARELAQRIHVQLGRTATLMKGEGYISGEEKDIVYCVVTRAEIFELKKIINSVEGSTFTTISDVSEIVGNHMKKTDVDAEFSLPKKKNPEEKESRG